MFKKTLKRFVISVSAFSLLFTAIPSCSYAFDESYGPDQFINKIETTKDSTSADSTAAAERLADLKTEDINAYEDIGSYTMSLYKYFEPTPYDVQMVEYLDNYKEIMTTEPKKILFKGSKEEIYKIYDLFLVKFAYIDEIALRMFYYKNTPTYFLCFYNHGRDIDTVIAEYINEVNLNKALADALHRDTIEDTINTIYRHIRNNVGRYRAERRDFETLNPHMYRALSGVPQLCSGYAYLMTHLGYMNNIHVGNAVGDYNDVPHQWNYVYMSDGSLKWYDAATLHICDKDKLPAQYTTEKYLVHTAPAL